MDLVYSHLSPRGKAIADSLTSVCLIFFVVTLLYGGISSTQYALEYNQKNYSAWGPPMAPIKAVMTLGVALMLLQTLATLFKDLAKAKGDPIS